MSDDLTDDVTPGAGPEASDDAATAVVDASSSPANNRHLVRVVYSVAAVVVVLDQVSKYLAVKYLEGKPPVEVFGEWLRLFFLRNPGAAASQYANMLLGFALCEATGLFGLVIAFIILFG